MELRATYGRRSSEKLDLDIGVIYTHERRFMPPLLSSLAASGPGLAMRLVLVDNASADGIEHWRPHFPHVHPVRNEYRLGYADNMNRILAASTARYVLMMNTDMYFEPDEYCLTKMVHFMDSHPECGLSTCRLYKPDGSYAFSARRYQNLKIISARRLGMRKLFAKDLERYFYLDRPHEDSFACEWVSGCFMLLRREAIDEVGEFDSGFRKYFEDVDMCARMARAGWQVMINGQTYCFHHEQRASKRLFSADAWRHLQSYARWIRKWGFSPPKPAKPRVMPAPHFLPGVAAEEATERRRAA